MHRGIYLSEDFTDKNDWDSGTIRAQAALTRVPGSVLCGLSAAWWLTRGRVALPNPVDLGLRSGARFPGVRQLDLANDEVIEWAGFPCTSAARTAADILRLDYRLTAVAAVDALTNVVLVVKDEVAEALERRPRQRGLVIARQRLGEVEPNAGSFPETKLRLMMVDGGLARPVSQMLMFDDGGDFLGRADLGYDLLRLAIEYLGAVHSDNLAADWDRQNATSMGGILTLGVTARSIRHPMLLHWIERAGRRQHQVLGLPEPFGFR